MSLTRRDVVLGVGFLAALLVAEALAFDLFVSVLATGLALLVLTAATRPEEVAALVRSASADVRRSLALGVGCLALFGLTGFASDQLRHPFVDATELGVAWSEANAALAGVAAADLRWNAATLDQRAGRVADVRGATRHFAGSVNRLERLRAPEAGRATHLAVTAVYREMVELLDLLPGALARSDTDLAAVIWRQVRTLGDEAASFLELTSPR